MSHRFKAEYERLVAERGSVKTEFERLTEERGRLDERLSSLKLDLDRAVEKAEQEHKASGSRLRSSRLRLKSWRSRSWRLRSSMWRSSRSGLEVGAQWYIFISHVCAQ